MDETSLLQYCEERLARYKVPVRIVRTERLPRNAANKVMRRELKNHL
jgi:O-succinylbenzoic acid--CoA ligase